VRVIGYRDMELVASAASGQEGVRRAAELQPDLPRRTLVDIASQASMA
jgi:YesN/AraC family two-component response regulator